MPTEIHRAVVRKLIEAGAQLIEVLAPAEYEREHLAGAINLPRKRIVRVRETWPGGIHLSAG